MSTARSVARRGVVALLAVACLLAPASAGLAAETLSSLRSLSRQADVSALVVRLDDMQPIARLNPDRRLTPAAVSKLYAAAAALEQFGPDHRFSTRFVSEASLTEGVLEGDLVFDVDGTLVDSQADIVGAMGDAFAAVGRSAPARAEMPLLIHL